MIAQLHGMINQIAPPILVLTVHDVGYELECPTPLFAQLPEPNTAITLHTHLVIKEDAHALYGFLTPTDRDLFRELLKASGVGPKLALNILSNLQTHELLQCIQMKDTAMLKRIKGIGGKMAEKLIVDLHGRMDSWNLNIHSTHSSPCSSQSQVFQDTLAALIQLGYRRPLSEQVTQQVCQNLSVNNVETALRLALQKIQTAAQPN